MGFTFDIPVSTQVILAAELREQFNSLGTTHFSTDVALPKNPRNGMQRILFTDNNLKLQVFHSNNWITIINNIAVQNEVALRKQVEISVANVQWIIDHNFGRLPLVQCLDSSNRIIIPLDIQHSSLNRVIVQHSVAITGKVICIG